MRWWTPRKRTFVTLCSHPICSLEGVDAAARPRACDYVSDLGDAERNRLVSNSGVRLARYATFASAATVALLDSNVIAQCDPERMGVLTTAGPLSLQVAWEFGERQLREGPRLTNPLVFPHTIVSSVATTIAAALAARAFAFAEGCGVRAFLDVVHRACTLLDAGCASHVLACALFDASQVVRRVAEQIPQERVPSDAFISFLIDGTSRRDAVEIAATVVGSRIECSELKECAKWGRLIRCRFDERSYKEQAAFDTVLKRVQVNEATGGVLLLEAAHLAREDGASGVLLLIEDEAGFSGVVLR